MLDHLSTAEKKAVLFTTRLRFGPEVRVPRERAVDRIIERALYLASEERPFRVEQVTEVFREICRVPAIREQMIRSSLARLIKAGRVLAQSKRYSLSPHAMREVDAELDNAERTLTDVIRRLFREIAFDVPDRTLREFFLTAMADVFSLFGDSWVKSLVGAETFVKLLRPRDVEVLVERACKAAGVDPQYRELLFTRLMEFLHDTGDPLYSVIKFNFGQSFYVAKLLGYDTPIDVLSAELYNGATFYLDSNVVLTVLLSVSRHSQSIQELARVCKRLNARLAVTEETLAEVVRRSAFEEAIARRVYDRVPERLVLKTKDDFFQSYRQEKIKNPAVTVDDFFAPFRMLRQLVVERLGAEVIDLPGEEIQADKRFETVKRHLQDASEKTRGVGKRPEPLRHDAVHYLWIERAREANRKVWFVSLDSSLPMASTSINPDCPPFALNLDALLQSLSTFVSIDEECVSGGFSEIFSRLIAAQIMPLYPVFEVTDFAIFDDLGMDCGDLPVEDVESALSHVKSAILHGGPYFDGPREEAMYALRTYFAVPEKRVRALLVQKDDELEGLRSRIDALESGALVAAERLTEELRRADLAEQAAVELRRAIEEERSRGLAKRRAIVRIVFIEAAVLALVAFVDVAVLKPGWWTVGLYPSACAVGLSIAKFTLPAEVWKDVKNEAGQFVNVIRKLRSGSQ